MSDSRRNDAVQKFMRDLFRTSRVSHGLAIDFGIPEVDVREIVDKTMAAIGRLDLRTATGEDILAVMRSAAAEIDQLSTDHDMMDYPANLAEPYSEFLVKLRMQLPSATGVEPSVPPPRTEEQSPPSQGTSPAPPQSPQ